MIIHKETRIILKFANDEDGSEKGFVDLDGPSGGYPYAVNNPLNAYSFETIMKAEKYAMMFQSYPLKVNPVSISISVIVEI